MVAFSVSTLFPSASPTRTLPANDPLPAPFKALRHFPWTITESGALLPGASFFASLVLTEHVFLPAFNFAESTFRVQRVLPQVIVPIVPFPFLLSLTRPFLALALARVGGDEIGIGCQLGSKPRSRILVMPLPSVAIVSMP